MEYEDFKIGDRVGRYYGDKIEKATIIDIQHGMYLLKFDNEDYEDLFSDQEKIIKIEEEKKMKKEKFKVGDLVKVIEEDDGNESIVNKIGRITEDNGEYFKIEFKEDIDGWGDGGRFWCVLSSKVVKYDATIKVGDKVKLNKKATIEDFTKNYWNGCQLPTLAFIKKQGNSDEIFVVEESHSNDCVDLKSEESNDHYCLVNINILEKIEEVVKEMTIEEISKKLGYKIKIKKEDKNDRKI